MEKFDRLAEGVYRLAVPFPGCWTGVVLVTGEEPILVDSGGCAETVDSCIVPALAALGLRLQDVTYLALTHTHGDHVGGAARLKQLHPGLKVATFADSVQRVREPRAYSAEIRARFPGFSAPVPEVLDGVAVDLPLQDGDRLGPLTLLHTPGHDSDSCCYLEGRTSTLITGDSLQLNGTVSQGCALLMDTLGYGLSLEKLRGLELQHIVCGHPYLPLGGEAHGAAACQAYLSACEACYRHDSGFVAGMAAAGVTDRAEIARKLIDCVGGVQPRYLFLPLYTVSSYLERGVSPCGKPS